ncbi:aminopeptidase P N-terminal domain-containing protein [soil metagenome]
MNTQPDVHALRRGRVLDALRHDPAGALIVPAAPALRLGADGEVRYLPDPDLYYLTGYMEPEAVLVLCPTAEPPFTLFVRDRDPELERWSGVRGGIEAATGRYAADAAHPLKELAERLPGLVADATTLYVPLDSGRPEVDAVVHAALAGARHARPRTGRGPHTVADPRLLLGPLRMRKDPHEIELIREAARISTAAFHDAARRIRGAEGEWQIEAALDHGFRDRAAMGAAFPSIVAGGPNATVLHYTSNDAPLAKGDLLLVDAGARYRMYCADITRTYPVSGRFSAEQRAVYDIVLGAHDAGIAASRVGATVLDVHEAALAVLVDGMIELGLVTGTRAEVIASDAHKRYFPHRTSHWLGLDVHDIGDYTLTDGEPARLEESMVLTVEPGIYIPIDDDRAPAALRGIGVRLEDDVLVTRDGPDVLTSALAIRPDAVEELVRGGATSAG